tara:strand:+ start:104 stop:358 length:255 start_codon:yes stop_codon:yes gene_type:complete
MKRRLWAIDSGRATFFGLYRFLYDQQRIEREASLAAVRRGVKDGSLELDKSFVPIPEEGKRVRSPEDHWVISILEEDPRAEKGG